MSEVHDDKHKHTVDWQWWQWFLQLGMTVAVVWWFVYAFAEHERSLNSKFALALAVGWLLVTALNCMAFKGTLRKFIGMTAATVNPVLMPALIYVCSESLEFTIGSAVIYVSLMIIGSALDVAVISFVSGALFVFLHKRYLDVGEYPIDVGQIIELCIAFFAMGGIALAWRFLIQKMYILVVKGLKGTDTITDQQSEINELKMAMAVHIVHSNQLTGYKYNETEDKNDKES